MHYGFIVDLLTFRPLLSDFDVEASTEFACDEG